MTFLSKSNSKATNWRTVCKGFLLTISSFYEGINEHPTHALVPGNKRIGLIVKFFFCNHQTWLWIFCVLYFFKQKIRTEKISEKVKYGKRKIHIFIDLKKSIYIEIYVCIYGARVGKCASFTINFSFQTHI